jgi:hypothetical protein
MSWLTHWIGRRLSTAAPRRPSARLRLEALEERQVPTVNYYGGALLQHVQAQGLYLGSEWSSVPANGAQPQPAALDTYLTTLVGGAYMQALTTAGYGVGTGTDTKGAVDPAALANNLVISDAYIQARIQADVTNGVLQTPIANNLYVVYVQPNVAVNLGAGQGTTQQGILGYHGAFGGTDGQGHAIILHYAVIAYPGGTVGNSSLGTSAADQLTAVTSHEVAEAATDPNVNYSTLGWYDPRNGEIGDITENNPNAYVRLNGYLVQEVAAQNDQLLVINTGGNPNPPPANTVSTTSKLTAGTVHYHRTYATVTLTVVISPASGSTLPGGTVELMYQGSVLGTATVQVVNGVAEAVFNVEFFANGNYTFSAVYQGNSQFQGSTSNSLTVTV